jgi:hypothetical protein
MRERCIVQVHCERRQLLPGTFVRRHRVGGDPGEPPLDGGPTAGCIPSLRGVEGGVEGEGQPVGGRRAGALHGLGPQHRPAQALVEPAVEVGHCPHRAGGPDRLPRTAGLGVDGPRDAVGTVYLSLPPGGEPVHLRQILAVGKPCPEGGRRRVERGDPPVPDLHGDQVRERAPEPARQRDHLPIQQLGALVFA